MPNVRNVAPAAPARPTLTRAELLALWQAARHRRDAAHVESEEYQRAAIEVGEIEVAINALDVEASEGRHVEPAHRDATHS